MSDWIVTLVHGTFAHGAAWVKDGAPLPAYLSEKGDGRLKTVPFEWSGNNTHEARIRAGEELIKHISEIAIGNPTARQAIIAHSHGGNVALYALSRINIQDFKVVMLGTPFFTANDRNLKPPLSVLLYSAIIFFVVVFPLLLLPLLFNDAGLLNIFPIILYIPTAMVILKSISSYIREALTTQSVLGRMKFAKSVTATIKSNHKAIFVSVKGDEAMSYLSIFDLITSLPSRLVNLSTGIGFWLASLSNKIFGNSSVNSAASVANAALSATGMNIAMIAYILPSIAISTIVVACFAITVPLIVILYIKRAASFDNSVSFYVMYDVIVSIWPSFIWNNDKFNAFKSGEALSPFSHAVYGPLSFSKSLVYSKLWRHSTLYVRDDIIADVAKWILEDVRPARARSAW
jgi:hypothetical protein